MKAHALLGWVVSISLMGCGTTFVAPRDQAALIATPQTSTDVRAAIVRALADRKFRTATEERHRIVAELAQRDRNVRVEIHYNRAKYDVRLVDVRGYETHDEAGKHLVDSHVARAIDKLYATIDEELARPAKERAKAEAKQRDYDMRMQESRTAQAQAEAQAASGQTQASQAPSNDADDDDGAPQQPAPVIRVEQQQQSGSVSSTCCVNGAQYTCASNAAFQRCMMMDVADCTPAGRCQ